MDKQIINYKDLLVWQKAYKLCLEVYKITTNFPRSELYGLVSQMRRSALSIPSNISEGHTRQYTKEFIHFLFIALASSSELETQIIISHEMNYMRNEDYDNITVKLVEVRKMLNGLINSLRNRIIK